LLAFFLAVACLWVGQALQIGSNFWLSVWSDEGLRVGREGGREGGKEDKGRLAVDKS